MMASAHSQFDGKYVPENSSDLSGPVLYLTIGELLIRMHGLWKPRNSGELWEQTLNRKQRLQDMQEMWEQIVNLPRRT